MCSYYGLNFSGSWHQLCQNDIAQILNHPNGNFAKEQIDIKKSGMQRDISESQQISDLTSSEH